MADIKEPVQGESKILKNDNEETVLLRRDSHTLRENRRQSRQRTPTAMVSHAFNFLNEDLDSTVDVFENGSFDIPDSGIDIAKNQAQIVDQSNDVSVCLRPSEDTENNQGKNRKRSRQHTPTALVSQAFGFLSDNLVSSDVFENVPCVIPEQYKGQGIGNLSGDSLLEEKSSNFKDTQDNGSLRECRLKDSGFASLERQLDKESIELAFSELNAESVEGQKADESVCVKSVCDRNQDEENALKQKETETSSQEEHVSAIKENGSSRSENVVSSEIVTEEPLNEHDSTKSSEGIVSITSGTVQDIKERVALVMKVLEDTNDELDDGDNVDNEDKRLPCAIVEETNVTHQSEVDDSQELLCNVNSLIPYKDADLENCIGQDAEMNTVSECHAVQLSEPELVSNNSEVDAHIVGHSPVNVILKKTHVGDIVPEIAEASDSSEADQSKKTEVENEEVEPFEASTQEIYENAELESVSKHNDDESENIELTEGENLEMMSSKIIRVERTDQTDGSTGDSSDEDTGIYAESFRRSNWIRVSKEGRKLNLNIPVSLPSTSSVSSAVNLSQIPIHAIGDGEEEKDAPLSASAQWNTDDVFIPPEGDSNNKTHKRSDSTTSTSSETEFKRHYVSRRKCLIQRAHSQQEYHRLSARIYEDDKEVILERNAECQDLGLHLLDSHPAYITSVDPGSPADKAGIVEGQILVSVNDVSVLTTNHDDIIELIQKCEGNISIGVANSDFQPVRDLQAPVIAGCLYKLGHSSLMRMWKKRYFILRHDNCLYYYKNEQDMDPLGALPLCGYTISRHTETNKDYCFKAEKYGSRSYFFMTDNRDQMTEWVGAMTQAAVRSKKRKENFLSVSSHNVSLPALDIRRPECSGYLGKLVNRSWSRRYCVLKDACIYYYKDVNSLSALGVAHLHGYTVDVTGHAKKKNSFCLLPPDPKMRTFYFSVDNDTDKKRWVEALIHSIQRWVKVDN